MRARAEGGGQAEEANDIDPIHKEMVRDLADIAEIARWAAGVGANKRWT